MTDSNTVVVHPGVDLDAVTCIVLTGVPIESVVFLSANTDELPPELVGARVLDHPLGEKGDVDSDGTRHSAAASMPEAAAAHPNLIAEVDEHDSTGIVRHPRFSLRAIFGAYQRAFVEQGLQGEDLDRALIVAFSPLVQGLNLRWQDREQAIEQVKAFTFFEAGGVMWAIPGPDQSTNHAVNEALQERGCVGALFDLGVLLFPGHREVNLKELGPHLPTGWFVHTGGYHVSWRTRKAPRKESPPKGTPQTMDELARLMQSVL